MSHCRWNLLPPLTNQSVRHPGFSMLLVQLLYNRGVTRPEEFPSFLTSDSSLLNDPLLLPDAPQAVARIYRALLSGEKMAVYGDYDADGINRKRLRVRIVDSATGAIVGSVITEAPDIFSYHSDTAVKALKADLQGGS